MTMMVSVDVLCVVLTSSIPTSGAGGEDRGKIPNSGDRQLVQVEQLVHWMMLMKIVLCVSSL